MVLNGFEELSGRHELTPRATRMHISNQVRPPLTHVHEVASLRTDLNLQLRSVLHHLCQPRRSPLPAAQPRRGYFRRELCPAHAKFWRASNARRGGGEELIGQPG